MRFRLLFGIALECVLKIRNRLVFKVKHIRLVAKPECFFGPFPVSEALSPIQSR